MPILSTKTTAIPGLPAPSTPDLLAFQLHTDIQFKPGGVTGLGLINVIPFRANVDGSSPLKVGDLKQLIKIPDLFEAAKTDADLAAILTAIQTYVQNKVTALGA